MGFGPEEPNRIGAAGDKQEALIGDGTGRKEPQELV